MAENQPNRAHAAPQANDFYFKPTGSRAARLTSGTVGIIGTNILVRPQGQCVKPGDRFAKLTVLGWQFRTGTNWHVVVACECGTISTSRVPDLIIPGKVISCGCHKRELASSSGPRVTTHGATRDGITEPLYQVWRGMHRRCYEPAIESYRNYGGRGITVCEEWHNYTVFREWATGYRRGLSIERLDVNGHYEPANCAWATQKEQSRNKRDTVYVELDGEKKPLIEWCEILGSPYSRVKSRYHRGLRGASLFASVNTLRGRAPGAVTEEEVNHAGA